MLKSSGLLKIFYQFIKMNSDPYKLIPLASLTLQQVFEFTGKHFDHSEPMCSHLKLTSQLFCKDFGPIIKTCYQSGFSFAVKFEDQIASLLLSTPLVNLEKCISQIPNGHYSPAVSNIIAILTQVEDQYRPEDPHKTIYHFIVSTKDKFKGKGLIQRILKHSEHEGVSKGYLEYFADCTGKISQKLFAKLGYQPQKQVNYQTFEFQGKYPFETLNNEDSAKLMVKKVLLSNH